MFFMEKFVFWYGVLYCIVGGNTDYWSVVSVGGIMSSVSSQSQFRLTQPPSKVLHLRNLPWECTEEELVELGKPFGNVVNTKCNVGPNRNQAFIEFVSVIGFRFLLVLENFFVILNIVWWCSFRRIWIKLLRWYRIMHHPRSLLKFEGRQFTCSILIGKK